jgi:hypothetical protein
MRRILSTTALLAAVVAGACGAACAQADVNSRGAEAIKSQARAKHTFTNEDLLVQAPNAAQAPVTPPPKEAAEPPRSLKEITREQAGVEMLISSTQEKVAHSSGEYHDSMVQALLGFQQRMDNLREEQHQREILDKVAFQRAKNARPAAQPDERQGSS